MTTLGIEHPTFLSVVRRATIALQGHWYLYSNRPKVCSEVQLQLFIYCIANIGK